MKHCYKCKLDFSIDHFSTNKSKKDGLSSCCKTCNIKYQKEWYKTNKSSHQKTTKKNSIIARNRNKEYILDFLKGKSCKDCGFTNIICLTFDHTSDNKLKCVSELVSHGHSVSQIQEEIDKCDIVCCNCHKIRTDTRAGNYRTKA